MNSPSLEHAKLSGSAVLSRLLRNAAALLASDVLSRATTFAMYVLVARHLGVFEVGQMSLALTLFYVFQVVAVAGLKTLITREVAKDKTETDRYLVNGSMVVIASSLVTMLITLLFVWSMGYARDTALIILLLSLGLLPYALSAICEAIFQAWERMHYIAYANVPSNVFKVGLAFLLLSQGYGVYHLVILIVASHVVIASTAWGLMLWHITTPRITFDPDFSLTMVRTTSTFLGIDVIIAVWASAQIILLSVLASETEVGLFSAAAQLMVPITLVFQSIVLSIFPLMCQRFTSDFQDLKKISEQLLELLLIFALPTAVGLFFLADAALVLLYGDGGFSSAAVVLRVMVGVLIFRALTSALGQVLLAGLKEKVTLRIVTINTIISLILGLLLIGQFGLVGAALAVLFTSLVNFVQHYVPVSKLLSGIDLASLIWKPSVACLLMAGYLLFGTGEQSILLTIVLAATAYAAVLFVLEVWTTGGPRRFGAKYRFLWSR